AIASRHSPLLSPLPLLEALPPSTTLFRSSALVFPMRNDPNRPVSRQLAADWLKRAYRYAKIERPKGGLWHPFRRKFATERKFYPLRDVADAGGWKDVGTLLTCYQLSDEDTIRAVMDNPKPLRRPGTGRG